MAVDCGIGELMVIEGGDTGSDSDVGARGGANVVGVCVGE